MKVRTGYVEPAADAVQDPLAGNGDPRVASEEMKTFLEFLTSIPGLRAYPVGDDHVIAEPPAGSRPVRDLAKSLRRRGVDIEDYPHGSRSGFLKLGAAPRRQPDDNS